MVISMLSLQAFPACYLCLFVPVVSAISFVLSLLFLNVWFGVFFAAVVVSRSAPCPSIIALQSSALILGSAILCSSGWLVLRTFLYSMSITK